MYFFQFSLYSFDKVLLKSLQPWNIHMTLLVNLYLFW